MITRLQMLFFIAWRNIWRNPVRSVLTISAIAGSLVAVILYSALMEGMFRQMVDATTEVSTGHIQMHRQAFTQDQDIYATMPWDYLEQIEKDFPDLHIAPRLYASGLASSQQTSNGVTIKGIDPVREPQVTRLFKHVLQGTVDLGSVKDKSSDMLIYNVVIGSQLARNMQLSPGDELVLVTQAADGSFGNGLFKVSAILKPVEPNFDRMGVLMSVESWQQLIYLETGFHELAISLDDIDQMLIVQEKLSTKIYSLTQAVPLDELGGPVLIRNWRQLAPTVSDMLDMSSSMLLVIGAVIVALASMGLLNTQLMSIYERNHEFGILLSIGMQGYWLMVMVLLESLFLALVSAVVGTLIGLGIYKWLMVGGGIDLSSSMPDGFEMAGVAIDPVMTLLLSPSQVLTACALMLVITLFTGFIPAWRMVRLKPAEVMR